MSEIFEWYLLKNIKPTHAGNYLVAYIWGNHNTRPEYAIMRYTADGDFELNGVKAFNYNILAWAKIPKFDF